MDKHSQFIVSADWLKERLGNPEISIIDASWYLPAVKRNPKQEYDHCHIPGAVFFNHDKVCDETSGLPHTLPSPEKFSEFATAMGVNAEDTIVVYDGVGFFSAPRAWWMFRVMGAKNVFVLDGGFDHWKEKHYPVTDEKTVIKKTLFKAKFAEDKVVLLGEMRQLVDGGATQIVDARGHKRFLGEEAEPRPGMRAGHMPGAHNVPATTLSVEGNFKDLSSIKTIFKDAGINVAAPVVTTCGSGVTAAVLALALESLGNHNVRLYDGSWSEWGGKKDTPVVTGNEDRKR
ncbi:3-mercaptopyruvate sulfurtransferase [uncultured Bartonella sp.]|uniref:3-mercaptopyruvate sulfurtransferase n=1 Tax=uncultured Bartonella sp. TaxID=104108 RepID=UPI00262A7B3F|nr:3-mercaptopyruvate sulfurtransferase [uncultured Bartonella sp.]